MFIDFFIAALLIICIIVGERRGFVMSFLGTFGWLFSVGGAYLYKDRFTAMVDEKTGIRDDLTVKIAEYIKENLILSSPDSGAEAGENISDAMSNALKYAADKAFQATADQISSAFVNAFFPIFTFFLLILIIKIGMYVIQTILAIFLDKDSPLSSVNSILGIIFSLIKGIILSLVIVLGIYIIAVMLNISVLLEQIDNSIVCEFLMKLNVLAFAPELFHV